MRRPAPILLATLLGGCIDAAVTEEPPPGCGPGAECPPDQVCGEDGVCRPAGDPCEGVTCDAPETCVDGRCACAGELLAACGGACISVADDDENCGACGDACEAPLHCSGGSCACRSWEEPCARGCCAKTIEVPEGPFLMGCDAALDPGCEPGSSRFEAFLPAFRLERTEVTQEQYERCRLAGVCPYPTNDGPYHPVTRPEFPVRLTLAEARSYCAFLGGRLPSLEEWEKAARGRDGRNFPWGDEEPGLERAIWLDSNDGLYFVGPVESHERFASPYGFLHMAGNVAEWVEDPGDWSAYCHLVGIPPDDMEPSGTCHPTRGGGYNDPVELLRTWVIAIQDQAIGIVGARCVVP